MKSEYFVLLPNETCFCLQSVAAIPLKTKKLCRKICHSKMLWYKLRSHLKKVWTENNSKKKKTSQNHERIVM